MTPFEDQLRQALARKEAPPGFTARVLARTRQRRVLRMSWASLFGPWWFERAWAWRLAQLAAALLLVSGATLYREHERAVEGREAKEKLMTAVRIAGTKLQETQQHVMRIQFGREDR